MLSALIAGWVFSAPPRCTALHRTPPNSVAIMHRVRAVRPPLRCAAVHGGAGWPSHRALPFMWALSESSLNTGVCCVAMP